MGFSILNGTQHHRVRFYGCSTSHDSLLYLNREQSVTFLSRASRNSILLRPVTHLVGQTLASYGAHWQASPCAGISHQNTPVGLNGEHPAMSSSPKALAQATSGTTNLNERQHNMGLFSFETVY